MVGYKEYFLPINFTLWDHHTSNRPLSLLSVIYVGVRFLTILDVVLKSSTSEVCERLIFLPLRIFVAKEFDFAC